jgi:hypothetical protein
VSVKGKIYSTFTVVGLIAAAVLFYGIFGDSTNPVTGNREDKEVVLYVSFDPVLSHPLITVQLSATVPVTYPAGDTGVWERTMRVPSMTRVTLGVTQDTAGYTECTILSNGKSVPGTPEGMNGPGTISCQYWVD